MSKVLIDNYVFDKDAKTIEFTDYFSPGITLPQVLAVVNVTVGRIMLNPTDPSLVGATAGNVLTLNSLLDTSDMDDADELLIFYEDPTVPKEVVLGSRIAGEDLLNDWIKILLDSDYVRINTATTTVIKSGAGRIMGVILVNPVASASLTLYDNTAGSGTVIMAPTLPATLLNSGPSNMFMGGAKFNTGLTGVSVGTAEWLILKK